MVIFFFNVIKYDTSHLRQLIGSGLLNMYQNMEHQTGRKASVTSGGSRIFRWGRRCPTWVLFSKTFAKTKELGPMGGGDPPLVIQGFLFDLLQVLHHRIRAATSICLGRRPRSRNLDLFQRGGGGGAKCKNVDRFELHYTNDWRVVV